MADQIQCPICDFTVQTAKTDSESLLGLLGGQPAVSLDAETQMVDHLEAHTALDWVKAFKMADAYIAQLEAETQDQQRRIDDLDQRVKFAAVQRDPTPAISIPAAQEGLSGMLAPDGRPMEHYLTPAEIARKQRQMAIRAQIESHDPNETLIPFMNPATRPEGVVGRKM